MRQLSIERQNHTRLRKKVKWETKSYEIGTDKSYSILKDIATGQDRDLETAVAKAIENRKYVSYNATFLGSNNSGFQLGIIVAT